MLKYLRTRSRRFVPALFGTAALIGALSLATIGGSSSATATPSTQLAAANRSADQTANRGSGRTHVQTLSEIAAASPTTVLPTTTTTAVPETTTTVAPTTTTTVAPTTTTTVKPAPTTTTTTATPAAPVAASGSNSQSGGASYYAQPWANKGCAHKTLPKGTVLTVTNLSNGKSTTCVVNDRGPYISGRIVDLDTSIFKQVASTSSGVFQARISW